MITTTSSIPINSAARQLLHQFQSPWKMRLYFLQKLPSAFFWGLQIAGISPEKASVRIPYRWSTKNPFRSIYFAAQAGAAELSTGLLCLLALQGQPKVSMLVVNLTVSFSKKADTASTFTCLDGAAVFAAVQKAVDTNEAQTVAMKSIGKKADGTIVSETVITWSFKRKD